MKIKDLPFLHFLMQMGVGRETWLVSPMELEEEAISGGCFSAPVQGDGKLFPAYRFHYSYYWGNGKFLEREGRKQLFHGIAIASKLNNKDHLLLTFDTPYDDFWGPHSFFHYLPRSLRHNEDLILPMLRRVPRQSPRPYSGRLWHQDFESKLIELEYADEKAFEYLFDEFHISIIGCDPRSKYETRRP